MIGCAIAGTLGFARAFAFSSQSVRKCSPASEGFRGCAIVVTGVTGLEISVVGIVPKKLALSRLRRLLRLLLMVLFCMVSNKWGIDLRSASFSSPGEAAEVDVETELAATELMMLEAGVYARIMRSESKYCIPRWPFRVNKARNEWGPRRRA